MYMHPSLEDSLHDRVYNELRRAYHSQAQLPIHLTATRVVDVADHSLNSKAMLGYLSYKDVPGVPSGGSNDDVDLFDAHSQEVFFAGNVALEGDMVAQLLRQPQEVLGIGV
jgi:hypothetical protein